MTEPIDTNAGGRPWLDGLPAADDPDAYEAGECPWAKFGRLEHESRAYRFGDTLIIRDHGVAKEVMGDRRFLQGMSRRIARKSPMPDQSAGSCSFRKPRIRSRNTSDSTG